MSIAPQQLRIHSLAATAAASNGRAGQLIDTRHFFVPNILRVNKIITVLPALHYCTTHFYSFPPYLTPHPPNFIHNSPKLTSNNPSSRQRPLMAHARHRPPIHFKPFLLKSQSFYISTVFSTLQNCQSIL